MWAAAPPARRPPIAVQLSTSAVPLPVRKQAAIRGPSGRSPSPTWARRRSRATGRARPGRRGRRRRRTSPRASARPCPCSLRRGGQRGGQDAASVRGGGWAPGTIPSSLPPLCVWPAVGVVGGAGQRTSRFPGGRLRAAHGGAGLRCTPQHTAAAAARAGDWQVRSRTVVGQQGGARQPARLGAQHEGRGGERRWCRARAVGSASRPPPLPPASQTGGAHCASAQVGLTRWRQTPSARSSWLRAMRGSGRVSGCTHRTRGSEAGPAQDGQLTLPGRPGAAAGSGGARARAWQAAGDDERAAAGSVRGPARLLPPAHRPGSRRPRPRPGSARPARPGSSCERVNRGAGGQQCVWGWRGGGGVAGWGLRANAALRRWRMHE